MIRPDFDSFKGSDPIIQNTVHSNPYPPSQDAKTNLMLAYAQLVNNKPAPYFVTTQNTYDALADATLKNYSKQLANNITEKFSLTPVTGKVSLEGFNSLKYKGTPIIFDKGQFLGIASDLPAPEGYAYVQTHGLATVATTSLPPAAPSGITSFPPNAPFDYSSSPSIPSRTDPFYAFSKRLATHIANQDKLKDQLKSYYDGSFFHDNPFNNPNSPVGS